MNLNSSTRNFAITRQSYKIYLITITLTKQQIIVMESIPKNRILEFNHDTMVEVRKLFDLNEPGAMTQAVEILEEWVKKQEHFVKKDFDKHYLETTILMCKGSIERAKQRLDKACTLRTLMPDYFGAFDLKSLFDTEVKCITHAYLPKMTINNERVMIVKQSGQKFEPSLLRYYARAASTAVEYGRRHDYPASYQVIIDYMDANVTELVTTFTMAYSDLQEVVAIIFEVAGFRISGIYIVSSSKLIDIVLNIFKQMTSDKIGDRVFVKKDYKQIYDIFGDILPEEYGGKERSLRKLHDEFVDIFTSEDNKKYLIEMSSARTDESLRQKDQFNEQYMGMPGTFRTLSVD